MATEETPARELTAQEIIAQEVEGFEKLTPKEIAKTTVSKEAFFLLTPLRGMRPEAAEATYQRWISVNRIKEQRKVIESPDGTEPDKVEIRLEAKWVNSERRRANINARQVADSVVQGFRTVTAQPN